MIEILLESPVLLLFTVAAFGYALGEIKIGGFNLGISAVLFVGLFFGSLHPELKLPEYFYTLGLVLFVYTIGLSNGPGFYRSLKLRGLRDNLFGVGIVLFGILLTFFLTKGFHLKSTIGAGLFSGSMTNTPALASVIDYIRVNFPKEVAEKLISEPVVSYSVAYPFGVIGVMLSIYLFQSIWKINYDEESLKVKMPGLNAEKIVVRSLVVTKFDNENFTELIERNNWDIAPGRIRIDERFQVITDETIIKNGDVITIVGHQNDIGTIVEQIGTPLDLHLERDREDLDFRRVFVSNYKLAGLKISELKISKSFGAIVTRIRRGDTDLVARPDTTIEIGDRVRVVAPREKMEKISKFFGDSYKSLSEINIMTFGLGIAIGLLVGFIPIPLPNGTFFKLGFAGGPLIIGLIFGIVGRTGPLIWSLPYGANLTLRQLGLMLFLAGVGTRSGYSFVETLTHQGGLTLFFAAAIITFTVSSTALIIGYKFLKIPMSLLIGMVAGIHTQPAVLAFSCERTKNEIPNIGYATVYPFVMISKIVLIQLLFSFMQR